ncbi:MAG: sensor histidine kinase KdpD [Oligoflexia bacterium]|nr:sensor histidine kinase KdpD [Oligoflexia bacterium]
MEEVRPDPDKILASIKRAEKTMSEGRLRIFLGMAAGVGKTYAMISSAHQRLAEGIDVIVGIVDTHGRKETEEKLQGLTLLPRKIVEHRGVMIEEFDVETVLRRRPQLVVVDELAHTNPLGSRHPKRWQDVFELLENGIDVYSALNIQHIESRKDDVEGITEITIHETVPDSVIERADHIEIIDIPPVDLLKRLKEGKVYLGDKAHIAAENFFKENKLTALRQILLRFSADKVDKELALLSESSIKNRVWKTQDKILLALGYGMHSEHLIRFTKQVATNLRCPWFTAYIDTGKSISPKIETRVSRNLDLARELGATVLLSSEVDLVQGIDRICKENNITQIVIGKPGFHPFLNLLRGGGFVDKLNKMNNNVSIHLVRHHPLPLQSFKKFKKISLNLKLKYSYYIYSSLYVMLIGFLSKFLIHDTGLLPYRSIGLIFLFSVTLAGLFFPVGPTIWASFLAIQIWNFFFIPPLHTFIIESLDDITLALIFFFVSTITGILTSSVKKNQSLLRQQEEKSRSLYRFSQIIVESENKEECIDRITSSLSDFLNAYVAITIRIDVGIIEHFKKGSDWVFNRPQAWDAALWAFEKGKPAGKWTDNLSDAPALFVPLIARNDTVGIMGIQLNTESPLILRDREILLTIASQLALYLQRELFHESSLESEKLKQSEKLHQTLLNSVSHEIKTPLTAITGFVDALTNNRHDASPVKHLNQSLKDAVDRLRRVVDNILDISRIDSGMLSLKNDWFDLNELIDNAISLFQEELKTFHISKEIPEDFPLVFIDGRLLEQVLQNLILNSIKYSLQDKAIIFKLMPPHGATWTLYYQDHGPGVDEQYHKQLFDKLFRVPKSKPGGTGLGLSIVKSIIELHQGSIHVVPSLNGKGLAFIIELPLKTPPPIHEENL